MKYIKEIPDENKNLTEELVQKGWNILKEPSSLSKTIVLSIPVSVVLMAIAIGYLMLLFPEKLDMANVDGFSMKITINLNLILYIVGLLAYTFLHEMIHALMIPKVFRSEKTYWGMNGCFGFVYSEEEVKRSRFVLISIMPLLVLTFAVPLVLKIAGISPWYILLLCVINAGGACVDIFNLILIIKQVPSSGMVVSNGMRTLYK